MANTKHCQAPYTDALPTVLQHPAVTGDLKTVCSLLQTCKAWRAALQQCTAGHMTVTVGACPLSLDQPEQLSRFAMWLPKHSGLVGCLHVKHTHRATADRCAAAEQVIVISMQQAATRAAAAGTAPLLRLCSVSLGFMCSPVLLQALPAAALTQLSVEPSGECRAQLNLDSSSFNEALTQLTSLHSLCLTAVNRTMGNACLAALAQLPLLTQLELSWLALGSDLSLLPDRLRQLRLNVCGGSSSSSSSSTSVDLGHLTALQQLEWELRADPGPGTSLPASLSALAMLGRGCSFRGLKEGGSSMQHVSFATMQQLQVLDLADAVFEVPQLQALSSLSALTNLAISHSSIRLASREAPAWRHLPALKRLSLSRHSFSAVHHEPFSRSENEQLLEGLAAATSLTELEWQGVDLQASAASDRRRRQPEAVEAWCQHLTRRWRHGCSILSRVENKQLL